MFVCGQPPLIGAAASDFPLHCVQLPLGTPLKSNVMESWICIDQSFIRILFFVLLVTVVALTTWTCTKHRTSCLPISKHIEQKKTSGPSIFYISYKSHINLHKIQSSSNWWKCLWFQLYQMIHHCIEFSLKNIGKRFFRPQMPASLSLQPTMADCLSPPRSFTHTHMFKSLIAWNSLAYFLCMPLI